MIFTFGTSLRSRAALQASMAILSTLYLGGALLAQQTSASATKASTAGSESSANTETNTPTVSVNVKVVNVMATVRDKHGKILADLTKNDFALQEDSHPVNIQYFSKDSNLPLILGLLVDTSMSQRS